MIGNPALTIARLDTSQFSDDILVLRIRCTGSLVIAKDDVQNPPRHLVLALFEENFSLSVLLRPMSCRSVRGALLAQDQCPWESVQARRLDFGVFSDLALSSSANRIAETLKIFSISSVPISTTSSRNLALPIRLNSH